ncbi:hypothetical protein GCM10010289_80940 [Streptomyces violascens]|uniref:Uncharacterized protein n=1 Tax=Streptomyces violascens TaxID=67381 RepID=A0ABQ3QSA9_9ACTN|nr:hypothetical protein GCM10010289_80940 [Streptomyces violascens]GHI40125.1 hypothetical protein Sviol_45330 [Streptomyces violascens]
MDALGIAWDTADAQFAENLAAARAFAEASTLASEGEPNGMFPANQCRMTRTPQGFGQPQDPESSLRYSRNKEISEL